jgi:LTXXQ motif family protein
MVAFVRADYYLRAQMRAATVPALLAAAAAVALAAWAPITYGQGGYGGGGGGGGNAAAGGSPKPVKVEEKDLAEARSLDPENPVGFILDHATQLKLVDTQTTRLATIRAQVTRENSELKDRLDSIRPPGAPSRTDFSLLSPTQRDSVLQQRKAIAETMGQIHDNDRRARTDAMAVLTPEQQQRVAALEARMRGVLEDAVLSGQSDQKGGRSPPAGGRQP